MPSTTVDEQLISDLFDVQPDSVVFFQPVFGNEQILDFEVRYCNEAAEKILNAPKPKIIGERLSTTPLMDADSRKLIFEQCSQVWNDGQVLEYTYYSPGFDRYFQVQRSKIMEGILSITRDRTPEVKTELQIKEQAELLNSVIEGSPGGIALYRSERNDKGEIVDFRLQLANRRCAEITGFSMEELQRYSVKELMQIRAQSHFFDICKNVVEKGESVFHEIHSKTRDRWIAVSIAKHHDGYLLNYTDVTHSKKQAEQISGILDASLNGIISMEAILGETGEVEDFKVTKVNKAFTRILKLEAHEATGKTYLSIFPRAKEIGVFDLHVQVLQTGLPIEKEFYYDGEGFDGWYKIAISKMGENGLVQTFTETTESVRDKKQVQEAARFLQEVINGSHTGILVVEPVHNRQKKIVDFRFKSVNKTLSDLVKQEPEALIGQLHSKWFPEYTGNGAFEAYCRIVETGEEMHFENHFENKNNDRWMDVSGRKIGNDLLISFHEITSLKKLQLQLEAYIHELKNSNERLSQFTHIASHDLKEPLRKIFMFTNLLEQRFADKFDEGLHGLLSKIQNTSSRMQALIDDLLTYAHVSMKPALTRVSLNTLLQNVLVDLEAVIQEKKAVIDVTELPVIDGDQGQLCQLFQNLISNGLKFHKEGQCPQITINHTLISKKKLPADVKTTSDAGQFYRISVKDEGIGFPEEFRHKIFQLFQRLHPNDRYPGTGIGLAIVSKIVENHHGFVVTESAPGEGATFHVYLPVEEKD